MPLGGGLLEQCLMTQDPVKILHIKKSTKIQMNGFLLYKALSLNRRQYAQKRKKFFLLPLKILLQRVLPLHLYSDILYILCII